MAIQTVTDAIRYVGVDDNTLALFENQYPVQPMGAVSYTHLVQSLWTSGQALSIPSAIRRTCR